MAKKSSYIYVAQGPSFKKGKRARVVEVAKPWDDIEYGKSMMVDSKYKFPTSKGMATYGATSDLYKGGEHVLSFDNGWDSYWGKAQIKDSKSIRKLKEQAGRIKQYLDDNAGNMDPAKARRFREALSSANIAMQYKHAKNKADYTRAKLKGLAAG